MKTTINGFLHCKPADAYAHDAVNGYELTFFHCENMVECGYTLIKPISIDIDLPDNWNPANEIIATLQAKKASVMAEFGARLTEIDAAINKLLAIEYEPEPEQEREPEMVAVTREMAMDAGDPSMEGAHIKW